MRENISSRLQLGEVEVADIQFNPRSRDDIHQLLMALSVNQSTHFRGRENTS